MPGQEGVPAICAPMAKTLEDLEMVWKAVMGMKPWEYDHTVRGALGLFYDWCTYELVLPDPLERCYPA